MPDRCPPQRLELRAGPRFAGPNARHGPVSGLASGIGRCRTGRLPALQRSGIQTGRDLLTVAGAAPESHRLPVSPHLLIVPATSRAAAAVRIDQEVGHLRRAQSRGGDGRAQVRNRPSGKMWKIEPRRTRRTRRTNHPGVCSASFLHLSPRGREPAPDSIRGRSAKRSGRGDGAAGAAGFESPSPQPLSRQGRGA